MREVELKMNSLLCPSSTMHGNVYLHEQLSVFFVDYNDAKALSVVS